MRSFPIARTVKQLARSVRAGKRPARGIRILTYHGLVEQRVDDRVEASFHTIDDFRAHLRILRRCRVIRLGEVSDAMRERRWFPYVAITFDDGFRNNLRAAELLAEARLPATVFVAAGNISSGRTIWPTLLRLVLSHGSARTPMIDGARFDLGDPKSFEKARSMFKGLPAADRERRWAELVGQLRPGELEELVAKFPSISMMNWDEVRSLQSEAMAVGSHGLWHELHHAKQSSELRMRELVDSRLLIEKELGQPCRHFAYPNGTIHPSAADEVRTAGYELAVTMEPRPVRSSDPLELLPRVVPGAREEKLVSLLTFGS